MADENPYQPPTTNAKNPFLGGRVAKGNFLIAATASFIVGAMVWASSRWITGNNEPWDASYPFYSLVMLVAGTAIGIIAPKRFVAAWCGVWLGQVAAVLVIPWLPAFWLPLAMITTAIGSLFLLPGLFLGWGIRALMLRFGDQQ